MIFIAAPAKFFLFMEQKEFIHSITGWIPVKADVFKVSLIGRCESQGIHRQRTSPTGGRT
jgi:hypothetical protein